MSFGIRLAAEPLRSLPFTTIALSQTYMGLGAPFDHPIRNFKIQNVTDQPMLISFDGITDHDFIPSNAYWVFDITTNKAQDPGFYAAQGQRIYIQYYSVAPSLGSVFLSSYYAAD